MAESLPRLLLLYVPLTDPTAPYHSLSYVASAVREKGSADVRIRDTNIEALHHIARPEAVERLQRRCRHWRDELERQEQLSLFDQVRYRLALRGSAFQPKHVVAAMAALRRRDSFFDYPTYRAAAHCLQNWIEVVSMTGYPAQLSSGFSLNRAGIFNASAIHDLTDETMLATLVGDLGTYFKDVLIPEIAADPPDLVGVNVTYTSQLPFALWLGRELRKALPRLRLVAGGTEVSSVYKYATRSQFDQICAPFDACVIGEGESALVGIVEQMKAGGAIRAGAPNLVLCGSDETPRIAYENVNALPTPDFSDLDFDGYLSPDRFVYYSPTRGCYWNRCTFCDYGLNFGTPTSPWRQRSVDRIIDDLKSIAQTARFIYFSVDVLAPGALERLAEAIIAEDLDIRWAAEIRLERRFSAETCRKLRRSGCVAVSFGFESGSQRILDLIDKGTKVAIIPELMRAFAGAGIAVQMMGFTGFPGETAKEAERTFDFLEETADSWTIAGIGGFALTPGSIVARQPERFGIELPDPSASEGFLIRELQPSALKDERANSSALDDRRRRLATAEFERPFAGGIDAAHTMFYHDRYGLDFPRKTVAQQRPLGRDEILTVDGALVENVLFPIDDCADTEDIVLAREHSDTVLRLPAAQFLQYLETLPKLRRRPRGRPAFVSNSGLLLEADEGFVDFIQFIQRRETQGRPALDGISAEEEMFVQAAFAQGILRPSVQAG